MKPLSKSYCLKPAPVSYARDRYLVTKQSYAELLVAQALICGAQWQRPYVPNRVDRQKLMIAKLGEHPHKMILVEDNSGEITVYFKNYNKLLEQAHEKNNTCT